jgi:internalin A
MSAAKKISVFLGILVISFMPVLPTIAKSRQPINTKSFVQWCQTKLSVPIETRKTINALLGKAKSNNCQIANSQLMQLTELNLGANQISDVQPLASLTNLTSLYLGENSISDVRPLSFLTNLKDLSLYRNKISDIKPLASLTHLTYLSLTENRISDVQLLSSLINLTYLSLGENKISDIQPLNSLTNLTDLNLRDNQIAKKICPVKPKSICKF